ncbi:MAG: DUF1800 domain-containing protein, partial [Sphingobacteriales bacterium]
MKSSFRVIYSFLSLIALTVLCSFLLKEDRNSAKFVFPYKQAGLTEREAAAHLLSRFTYGAKA